STVSGLNGQALVQPSPARLTARSFARRRKFGGKALLLLPRRPCRSLRSTPCSTPDSRNHNLPFFRGVCVVFSSALAAVGRKRGQLPRLEISHGHFRGKQRSFSRPKYPQVSF